MKVRVRSTVKLLFAGGELPLQVAVAVPAYQFQGGAGVEVVGSDGGVICLAHVVLNLLVVLIDPLSIMKLSFYQFLTIHLG